MRNRLILAIPVALLFAAAVIGIAHATPASGVKSTAIASGTLDPVNLLVKNGSWMTQLRTKGETNLAVVENDVAPGGSFGWHSHPGPSLIIVKAGTLTFYHGDDPSCTPEIHSAGDAFIDPGTDVHVGVNRGSETAIVIVTRLLPAGAPARIDEPDPGICGL